MSEIGRKPANQMHTHRELVDAAFGAGTRNEDDRLEELRTRADELDAQAAVHGHGGGETSRLQRAIDGPKPGDRGMGDMDQMP